MKDLNALVMKAILDLPETDYTLSAYFSQLKPILDHLLPLIKNYIKSKDSQKDCISSIEEYSLQRTRRLSPSELIKIINYLYDEEVLNEDVITSWYKKAEPLPEFTLSEQNKLREHKAIKLFVKWLEEAEEESDS